MNKKTGNLSKRSRDDLNNLYKNNKKYRNGFINFVGDKAELSKDQNIKKRFKYNALNKLGVEILNKFFQSKDNTISFTIIL